MDAIILEVKGLIDSFKTVQSRFIDEPSLEKIVINYDQVVDDSELIIRIDTISMHYKHGEVTEIQDYYTDSDDDENEDFIATIEAEFYPFLQVFNSEAEAEVLEITRDILNHSFLHILS